MTTRHRSSVYALLSSGWTFIGHNIGHKGTLRPFVVANGADLREEPTAYMTSGHMSQLVRDSGKRTSMTVVAPSIIDGQEHTWKTTFTLEELAKHSTHGFSDKELASLQAYYSLIVELAA